MKKLGLQLRSFVKRATDLLLLIDQHELQVARTGARGTDLPPPFFLTFCLQIYF